MIPLDCNGLDQNLKNLKQSKKTLIQINSNKYKIYN